jgi:hypothetical protein
MRKRPSEVARRIMTITRRIVTIEFVGVGTIVAGFSEYRICDVKRGVVFKGGSMKERTSQGRKSGDLVND